MIAILPKIPWIIAFNQIDINFSSKNVEYKTFIQGRSLYKVFYPEKGNSTWKQSYTGCANLAILDQIPILEYMYRYTH